MPNYMADPDIRCVQVDGRFAIPDHLDRAEIERIERFLESDQVLESFYRLNAPSVRPPQADLEAAAAAAMAVYDQRSPQLAVGWQKFAVLQAGIAGCAENLDSEEIKEWAYVRVKEENPDWLGDFDEDIDRDMPMRRLVQLIGVEVLMARQSRERLSAPVPESTPGRGIFARFRE